MTGRVLLADADAAVARYLTGVLAEEGLHVDTVTSAYEVLRRAREDPPQLVLVDAELPGTGGLDVVRRLRSGPATASVPVFLLVTSASPADRAAGLSAGANDVVGKPFDTLELVALVHGVLQRTADVRAVSPLTGLPGNHSIDAEILGLAGGGSPYAVCHVDLDEFKSFNDAYGFLRGDDLLMLLARCLHAAASATPEPAPFVGHVGGDDFVVVCAPAQAEGLAARVVADFDAAVRGFYDAADAARGWLEVLDRRGELRRHPLVSVSIGIASHVDGDRDHRAVVAAANEMKSVAKSVGGSYVAVDRRR